jgi:hypothetical protein
VAKRVVGRVELRTEAGGVEAEALLDTGAAKSFVSSRLADELRYVRYGGPGRSCSLPRVWRGSWSATWLRGS